MGASGSLLKLEPCDDTNLLQQFNTHDVNDLIDDTNHSKDGKPFELIPSKYAPQGKDDFISGSSCVTAGWPFLYGVGVLNDDINSDNDSNIAIVVMNEADVDVDLQYTDDGGKTMITYGINGRSISTILI